MPDCTIAKASKGICRKCPLLGLELLEANNVWLRFGEPIHEVVQAFVDVESDDLQSPASIYTYCDLNKCESGKPDDIARTLSSRRAPR